MLNFKDLFCIRRGSALIPFLFAGVFLHAQQPSVRSADEPANRAAKAKALREKARQYLVKDEALLNYFSISELGISMFESPEKKEAGEPEFFLAYEEVPIFIQTQHAYAPEEALQIYQSKGIAPFPSDLEGKLNSLSEKPETDQAETGRNHSQPPHSTGVGPLPLSGIRIALDPGHIGGSMELAEMESKYMKIRAGEINGFPAPIAFNEGNLTMATALILKEELEKRGAEVILTRPDYGLSAFGYNFDDWKKKRYAEAFEEFVKEEEISAEEIEWWEHKAKDSDVFHKIFKYDEFKERARLINNFRPDLTLIIHFNVEGTSKPDKEGYFQPTENNFNMAFIPGSFMKGELDRPKDRMAFVRLLVSEEIKHSENFSDLIANGLAQYTGVPLIEKEEGLVYLTKASLKTPHNGVYARNLSLTRLVFGTLCFGESLYQNNSTEARSLFSTDLRVGNARVSNRLQDVARGYLSGILEWFGKD